MSVAEVALHVENPFLDYTQGGSHTAERHHEEGHHDHRHKHLDLAEIGDPNLFLLGMVHLQHLAVGEEVVGKVVGEEVFQLVVESYGHYLLEIQSPRQR